MSFSFAFKTAFAFRIFALYKGRFTHRWEIIGRYCSAYIVRFGCESHVKLHSWCPNVCGWPAWYNRV